MIDYEVKVFNKAYDAAASLCAPNMFVSTVITEKPTAFPAASLIEMSNTTVRRAQSSTPTENRARIMYQLEVYATSKTKCKTVYAAIDDAMLSMNFTRVSGNYINIPDNTKIFRYVARYEAEIDRDGNIYRLAA